MKEIIIKSILILFIIVTYNSEVFSQNSLKLYSNFIYSDRPDYPNYITDTTNVRFRFHQLSLGYQYHKNYEPREWEVRVFFKNQQLDDGEIRQFDAHVRYEFDAYFLNEVDFLDGLVYSLTPSLRFFYLDELIDAPSQRAFLTKNKVGGFNYALSLDFVYNLNERLYINLVATIVSPSFAIIYSYVDNPILTENQKEQFPFDFELFSENSIRIGVGYNLSLNEEEEIGYSPFNTNK